MATPPFTREELHECTLKYVLKGVARRLYDAANSDLQKRRMVTSVARSSPSSNISINHPHKNINSKARHGFKSSPIKISSYAFTGNAKSFQDIINVVVQDISINIYITFTNIYI